MCHGKRLRGAAIPTDGGLFFNAWWCFIIVGGILCVSVRDDPMKHVVRICYGAVHGCSTAEWFLSNLELDKRPPACPLTWVVTCLGVTKSEKISFSCPQTVRLFRLIRWACCFIGTDIVNDFYSVAERFIGCVGHNNELAVSVTP